MNNLKKNRMLKGLTIVEVARAIEISAPAAGKHESGDIKTPGKATRQRYVKFYDVDEEELFPDLHGVNPSVSPELTTHIREIVREEIQKILKGLENYL